MARTLDTCRKPDIAIWKSLRAHHNGLPGSCKHASQHFGTAHLLNVHPASSARCFVHRGRGAGRAALPQPDAAKAEHRGSQRRYAQPKWPKRRTGASEAII